MSPKARSNRQEEGDERRHREVRERFASRYQAFVRRFSEAVSAEVLTDRKSVV